MLIFKIRWLQKWTAKEGMADAALLAAVDEINAGLFDADLGGHVIKKRLGLPRPRQARRHSYIW